MATASLSDVAAPAPAPAPASPHERWAKQVDEQALRVDLLTPGVRCAGCLSKIENMFETAPGVRSARVNLSMRRVGVEFDPARTNVAEIVGRLAKIGFDAKPFDAEALDAYRTDKVGRELLACLAVSGFAAMNIMLLSVSVWSGAEGVTRDLMHWISAAIATPTIAFAGRPFFRSALTALSVWRLNMDVPISLAVLLAFGVSLFETANSGAHAYFDAGVSLLFFLLIGRYLDHRARKLARSAAAELAALSAGSATKVAADGSRSVCAVDELRPGDMVFVAPGERTPADGQVMSGRSEIDASMLTGESAPEPVAPGDVAHAGMMNLTGPLTIKVSAVADGTLLAEIGRLIEQGEQAKSRYTRMADRAAQIYAPVVHLVALAALLGWLWATGGDWRASILVAASVLIITCPCALGLAAPAVQTAAARALFRAGVLVKNGAALERLAEIDTVVFDKTGTLTMGAPRLVDGPAMTADVWPIAVGLARQSAHPLSKALVAGAPEIAPAEIVDIVEEPGGGVRGLYEGREARLGRADWVGAQAEDTAESGSAAWLRVGDAAPVRFLFEDALRPDARDVLDRMRADGLDIRILSGDRAAAVARTARDLDVSDWIAEARPETKLEALQGLAAEGRKVLMVGDGLNDAPSLAAAHASISPASASDVSAAAADLIFTGGRLEAVAFARRVAFAARGRALENFGFAALYNLIAVSAALLGLVTPLVAALAMSSSSIIVTLNALRLLRLLPRAESAALGDVR
ncbi:MAG: cadmium-translocating P-type ATPase [Neomegalonema sp.]|nr:cadmium-translocating P-type ATPase [Neomegalonema sp.]